MVQFAITSYGYSNLIYHEMTWKQEMDELPSHCNFLMWLALSFIRCEIKQRRSSEAPFIIAIWQQMMERRNASDCTLSMSTSSKHCEVRVQPMFYFCNLDFQEEGNVGHACLHSNEQIWVWALVSLADNLQGSMERDAFSILMMASQWLKLSALLTLANSLRALYLKLTNGIRTWDCTLLQMYDRISKKCGKMPYALPPLKAMNHNWQEYYS